MGGVSAAYFCDSGWAIDLFEAQSAAGGNATTLLVPDGDAEVAVDIGAESFNPRTHPLYWSLLHEIGAVGAADASTDVLVTMPGTLSVFDARTRAPRFVSSHAVRTPHHAIDLLRFASAARRFVADDPSPDITVGEWIDGLSLGASFTREVLLPWLASLTCYRVEVVRQQSLLAFLLLFVRIFPDSIFDRPKTYCSRIGLGGVLQLLLDRCENVNLHVDTPVSTLEKVDGGWFVETPGGRNGPYERVVVNAPPYASREFLRGVPEELLETLSRHEYYPARLIIHTDPIYMPRETRDWCSHNAAVDGDVCEATIWLGAFRRNPSTGEPVKLFKSWATQRPVESREVVAEKTFLHPLLSPATLHATRELEAWQGYEGLHFAGHFTTVTDLQETALRSGAAVAAVLNPGDARLGSLQAGSYASMTGGIDAMP